MHSAGCARAPCRRYTGVRRYPAVRAEKLSAAIVRTALALVAMLWGVCVGQAFAEDPSGSAPESRRNDAAARLAADAYKENLARYGKDPDYLVRPGLLASRRDKQVKIWARATGLPEHDPIEFFLIPQDSGKDYEAIAVAFAKPSDVHAALEFIGMKPGRCVDYSAGRCWPKGERVIMNMEWNEPSARPGGAAVSRRVRIEELVFDHNANRPLPAAGLVFTGSCMVRPEGSDRDVYAADVMDPKSIASDFNDPTTVMDVPRQAPKSTVYGTLRPNPAYKLAVGQPLLITAEPEYKDGRLRVRDLTLRISMPGPGSGPRDARYVLVDAASGAAAAKGETLVHLLAAFAEMTEAGQDPFLTVIPDGAMTLGAVHAVYRLLMDMDNERGIRIDGPPPGHLYYRAFFPKNEWRDRSRRLGRPWEFHVVEKDHKAAGTLILPADEIDDNQGRGDLKFTVGTPEEMAEVLVKNSNRFSQLVYIFAPRSMSYGGLMRFIAPSMKTHGPMYVFLPE